MVASSSSAIRPLPRRIVDLGNRESNPRSPAKKTRGMAIPVTTYDPGPEKKVVEEIDAALSCGPRWRRQVEEAADDQGHDRRHRTLQQVLTRAKDFDVIATMTLNGDYLSDALAAQVAALASRRARTSITSPGTRSSRPRTATAPKYANLDQVNPGSVILSGEMMLRYMGWTGRPI